MGVGARLYAVELFRVHPGEERRKPYLSGERRDLLLEVHKLLQADVEEVPRPARRVQDPYPSQPFCECPKLLLCSPERVHGFPSCLTAGFFRFGISLSSHLLPLPPERSHEHGLYKGQNILPARVMRSEPRPLARVQRPLEQGPEDGWLH